MAFSFVVALLVAVIFYRGSTGEYFSRRNVSEFNSVHYFVYDVNKLIILVTSLICKCIAKPYCFITTFSWLGEPSKSALHGS